METSASIWQPYRSGGTGWTGQTFYSMAWAIEKTASFINVELEKVCEHLYYRALFKKIGQDYIVNSCNI